MHCHQVISPRQHSNVNVISPNSTFSSSPHPLLMPKSRITEFTEDDLFDYLNDWDFSYESDAGVYAHDEREGNNVAFGAANHATLGRRKQRKWKAHGFWVSSRHFHLPSEVLERICFFSSQASLQLQISLVCKQWHQASYRYLRTRGVWEAKHDCTALIDMLQLNRLSALTINVLTEFSPASIFTPGSKAVQEHRMAWQPFCRAITALSVTSNGEDCVPVIRGLKELHYRATTQLDDDPILTLMPHLGFLRRLSLEYFNNATFPLFDILDQCANLEALTFKSRTTVNRVISPNSPPRQHRRLEELNISNAIIDQGMIERILDTCPNLTEFKAQHLNATHFYNGRHVKLPLEFNSLYRRAAEKCPRLQWFHLMMTHRSQGVAPLNLVPLHLPWIQRMSLTDVHHNGIFKDPWTPDREQRVVFSDLTHIEVCSFAYEKTDARSLDKILRCAPNLVHLSAGNVCFRLTEVRENWDPLDDWHRWPARIPKKTKKTRKREHKVRDRKLKMITKGTLSDYLVAQDWQCSRLHTLDISAFTSNYHPNGEDMELYRYLVQRCPGIVNLTLRSTQLQVGQQLPERLDSWPYYRSNPKDLSALKKNKVWAPNSIPVLGGLKYLESLTLIVDTIQGLVLANDFEYLRRTEKPISIGGDQDLHLDNNHGHTVIWPRLEMFTIEYGFSIVVSVYDDIVMDLARMRPGVAFRIGPKRK